MAATGGLIAPPIVRLRQSEAQPEAFQDTSSPASLPLGQTTPYVTKCRLAVAIQIAIERFFANFGLDARYFHHHNALPYPVLV